MGHMAMFVYLSLSSALFSWYSNFVVAFWFKLEYKMLVCMFPKIFNQGKEMLNDKLNYMSVARVLF
jgi:hypothetical protein